MSETPELNEHEEWEMRVQKTSREFDFPPTPNIARKVHHQLHPAPRRFVLGKVAAVLLALLLTIVFAVPSIRASVLEFLNIGAIYFIDEPAPTPVLVPTPSIPLLEFGTEVTLAEAQAAVDYPITLPTLLEDLGNPHYVYLQETPLPMVVLVWYEPASFDTEWLFLYIINSQDAFFKFMPNEPEYTRVNRRQAVWLTDPHLMEYVERSSGAVERFIQANVLIWETGTITYRLEGNLSLDEAIQVAESLQ